MARISVIIVLFFIFGLTSCNNRYNAYDENKDIEKLEKKWNSYCFQDFQFVDLAPETQGSKIFHNLINDPSLFMRRNAIRVLETLYYSPADSIPEKDNIHFSLCTCNGIAEKSENTKTIAIKLSTLWIEKTLSESDRVLSLAELKSLLIQQLAHAFIYNPQGCGSYPENDEMKAYVEGLSDAVRLLNGDISYSRPEKTDSYYSGMSKTGFFTAGL
jgi:Plant Basic Secretory Protein.